MRNRIARAAVTFLAMVGAFVFAMLFAAILDKYQTMRALTATSIVFYLSLKCLYRFEISERGSR